MSYKLTLQKAGAVVHQFKEFGSYQGDWWAKVTYKQVTGWVTGSYGSCSGCDAFEGEFGNLEEPCKEGSTFYKTGRTWDNSDECTEAEYEQALKDYDKRLVAFGERYLDSILSQEEAEKAASKHADWDMEAVEVVNFLKENKL